MESTAAARIGPVLGMLPSGIDRHKVRLGGDDASAVASSDSREQMERLHDYLWNEGIWVILEDGIRPESEAVRRARACAVQPLERHGPGLLADQQDQIREGALLIGGFLALSAGLLIFAADWLPPTTVDHPVQPRVIKLHAHLKGVKLHSVEPPHAAPAADPGHVSAKSPGVVIEADVDSAGKNTVAVERSAGRPEHGPMAKSHAPTLTAPAKDYRGLASAFILGVLLALSLHWLWRTWRPVHGERPAPRRVRLASIALASVLTAASSWAVVSRPPAAVKDRLDTNATPLVVNLGEARPRDGVFTRLLADATANPEPAPKPFALLLQLLKAREQLAGIHASAQVTWRAANETEDEAPVASPLADAAPTETISSEPADSAAEAPARGASNRPVEARQPVRVSPAHGVASDPPVSQPAHSADTPTSPSRGEDPETVSTSSATVAASSRALGETDRSSAGSAPVSLFSTLPPVSHAARSPDNTATSEAPDESPDEAASTPAPEGDLHNHGSGDCESTVEGARGYICSRGKWLYTEAFMGAWGDAQDENPTPEPSADSTRPPARESAPAPLASDVSPAALSIPATLASAAPPEMLPHEPPPAVPLPESPHARVATSMAPRTIASAEPPPASDAVRTRTPDVHAPLPVEATPWAATGQVEPEPSRHATPAAAHSGASMHSHAGRARASRKAALAPGTEEIPAFTAHVRLDVPKGTIDAPSLPGVTKRHLKQAPSSSDSEGDPSPSADAVEAAGSSDGVRAPPAPVPEPPSPAERLLALLVGFALGAILGTFSRLQQQELACAPSSLRPSF
jgi:hypothetical protein